MKKVFWGGFLDGKLALDWQFGYEDDYLMPALYTSKRDAMIHYADVREVTVTAE